MKQSSQTAQTVTVDVDVITETDKAWLVLIDNQRHWLPKSMVEMHEDGLIQQVEMPRHMAFERNII